MVPRSITFVVVLVTALALPGGRFELARGAERFVGAATRSAGGTLELRPDATVYSGEVRLRQICRWAEGDQQLLASWGDLVVARVTGDAATTTVNLVELRETLRDAGMNLATVRFAGPLSCTVTRTGPVEQPATTPAPVTAAVVASVTPTTRPTEQAVVTLRELLVRDLSDRIQIPIELLQISFNPQDEKLLSLAEPQFRFTIEPRRARSLGGVSWDVTAVAEGVAGATAQKAVVAGTARAWQDQLVAARPISGRQIIRADDVVERRALVDSLPVVPLIRREQAVNQQAAMDLKPGQVITTHLVEAVPLARPGQIVTVTLASGGVRISTVAKAVDEGTFGQTIRVRNEQTKEMYEVTLTGPQQATLTPGSNG